MLRELKELGAEPDPAPLLVAVKKLGPSYKTNGLAKQP